MYELFLEGWSFEQMGKFAKAIYYYKQAKQAGDRCATFHWNCIDRYGMLNCPINYENNMDWKKFTLTPEEVDCLLSCYRQSSTAESSFMQAIIYDILGNLNKTLIYLGMACGHHYGPACNYLAIIFHYKDYGVPVDYVEAEYWYRQASKYGYARAESGLGDLYNYIHKNYEEAMRWYQFSVEHNYLLAWCEIGHLYQNGWCGPKDDVKALECYHKVSHLSDGQFMLGMLYRSQKKDEEALKWFILAAEQGHQRAQFWTGYLYRMKDYIDEAIKWYILASDQGHSTARYNLGNTYYGINNGLSLKYYILATEAGDQDALREVSHMYKSGIGTQVDITKARHYRKLLADQNNTNAQYILGKSYHLEQPVDYKLAHEYYKLAALKGHGDSLCNLGLLYEKGLGVERDLEEAIKWWNLGVQQGHVVCCYNLATVHTDRKNYSEAITLYRMGPDYGLSLYNLGLLYKLGNGVPVRSN